MTTLEKILAGLATLKFALGMVPVSHKKADRYVEKVGQVAQGTAAVASQVGAVLKGGAAVPDEPTAEEAGEPKPRFCPSCGRQWPATADFCGACGTKLI
jgi:hypothetical protein